MRLTYHPEAEAELIDSAKFYENRAATLGVQFLDAVDRAIRIIQDDPKRGRVLRGDVRSHMLKRFPFSIYYRIQLGELRILAFQHHSRRPAYWKNRLAD
jgi:plasmid stabilization system protein ParE